MYWLILVPIVLSIFGSPRKAAFLAKRLTSRDSAWGCVIASVLVCGLIGFAFNAAKQSSQSSASETIALFATPESQDSDPLNSRDAKVTGASPVQPIVRQVFEEENRISDSEIDYDDASNTIQVFILNNDFVRAFELFLVLDDAGETSEVLLAQLERQALRQVKPLPVSDATSNLRGYELLSSLRPDNETYRMKVQVYSQGN